MQVDISAAEAALIASKILDCPDMYGTEDFGCSSIEKHPVPLLVLLHALEALFKLRDQRRFARLEAVASHDAPEIVAARPVVSIVDG